MLARMVEATGDVILLPFVVHLIPFVAGVGSQIRRRGAFAATVRTNLPFIWQRCYNLLSCVGISFVQLWYSHFLSPVEDKNIYTAATQHSGTERVRFDPR